MAIFVPLFLKYIHFVEIVRVNFSMNCSGESYHSIRKLFETIIYMYLSTKSLILLRSGGEFLSVNNGFSETGYPAFYQ